MESRPVSAENETCPCLVPVVNDRLWVVNTGVYCRRGDGRVRVPARATVQTTCMTPSYRTCDGYARSAVKADA